METNPKENTTQPELFTASDVARFCQVDLKTIHNWADKGEIRHFRTPGRHLRFRRLDVLDFLRKYGYPIPEILRMGKPKVVVVDDDPSVLAALRKNPHRAATDETGIPGQLLGQLVGPQGASAIAQDLAGRQNRVGLDASTAQRPRRPSPRVVVRHDELGAHHLRRAALRPDDGRQGKWPPGLFELRHSDEK